MDISIDFELFDQDGKKLNIIYGFIVTDVDCSQGSRIEIDGKEAGYVAAVGNSLKRIVYTNKKEIFIG